MLLIKFKVEGIMPERILNTLQKRGIWVYHVKKIEKNQIVFSVKIKDSKKVFAIYPNICYNNSVYSESNLYTSPYKITYLGGERQLNILCGLKNRLGIILGIFLFVFITSFSDLFIFKIKVVGTNCYNYEVSKILYENNIRPFKIYKKTNEKKAVSSILSLKDASFCSIKKHGKELIVDLRLDSFSYPKMVNGDMKAKHNGEILNISVLRGTSLKKIGDKVSIGDVLVGAYTLNEKGDKIEGLVMARVTILSQYQKIIKKDKIKEALCTAYLEIDGNIISKNIQKVEEGYLVSIDYEVIELINF